MDKRSSTQIELWQSKFKAHVKAKVDFFNTSFNNLSPNTKRISLIGTGITMAGICTLLIFQAMSDPSNHSIHVDGITFPKDINDINRNHMSKPSTAKLTHIGKMKGEIDGEFEAFHVALDNDGGIFINHDPEYSRDSLFQSKGWEPITRQQLDAYEKQLHFIPDHQKGLKR